MNYNLFKKNTSLPKVSNEENTRAFHEPYHTRNVKLSSRDDKLSGLGLVGPADVHASMMAPCVPNHQVRCEDNHISGHWLPICTKTEKEVSQGSQTDVNGTEGEKKVHVIALTFRCLRTAKKRWKQTNRVVSLCEVTEFLNAPQLGSNSNQMLNPLCLHKSRQNNIRWKLFWVSPCLLQDTSGFGWPCATHSITVGRPSMTVAF